jgi:peroxiredoxin Q/BCP
MLGRGDRAPDFTLPDQTGNPIRLTDLLEKGPVVLYFYPADFTPGCTKEACDLRDMHGEIAAAGLCVVGVSPQDEESHRRFAERYELPFTLVADPKKQAVRAYGVDGPLGLGVRRATFLIGANGTIEDAVLADLRIGRHAEFVKKAVAAAS